MLINSNLQTNGIFRAVLIDYDGKLRTYIPCLSSRKININNTDELAKALDTLPKPLWNVPNLEAMKHEVPTHPCWVTLENGDITRPIIMGWLGKGIMYSAGSSGGTSGGGSVSGGGSGSSNGSGSNGGSGSADVELSSDVMTTARQIFDYLIGQGYTTAGACAIIGNLYVEGYSWNGRKMYFDPEADNGLGYYGIVQWGGSRKTELQSRSNYNTLSVQLDFMVYELTRTYTNVDAKLKDKSYDNVNSLDYLSDYFCRYYEIAVSDTPGTFNADIYFDDYYLQGGQARRDAAREFYEAFVNNKMNSSVQTLHFIGDSRTVGMFELYNINTGNYSVTHEAIVGIGIGLLNNYTNGSKQLKNVSHIIITLGVNDVHSNYADAINAIAKAYNNIQVVFVSILPVIDDKSPYVKNADIETANQKISSKLTNCKYINIYNNVFSRLNSTTCPDGVHYSKELYQQIFNLIVERL